MKLVGIIRHMGGEKGMSPVSYYRVGLPLQALGEFTQLETRTYNQFQLLNMFKLAHKAGRSPEVVLDGCDFIVMSRLYGDDGADQFFGATKEKGLKVVFDTDDDLTEEHRTLDGRGDEFVSQLSRADLVTVSTPYLANRLEPYAGYRPTVLPNHVDFDWFSEQSIMAENRYDEITVGVIGTKTHYHDWLIVKDALAKLSREHDVRILVAGFHPDYLEEYETLSGVPYRYYPQLVRQFDIICCTLKEDDGFNYSKSSIKALEAMASARRLPTGKVGGAVPVCTDMTLYRRTVNNKHNGLLVDNDDWYEALDMLVRDDRMRNQLAYRGHRWVRGNRDIKVGYRKWKRTYLDL